MPNDTVCEGLFALEELAPRAEVAALAESLAAAPDEDAQLAQFENFLVRRSRSIAAPGPDLALPADWHARPMAALAEQHGIGVRQFERRFLASFGQPWRKVRQQLRCSSLITRLLDTPALAGARTPGCSSPVLYRRAMRVVWVRPSSATPAPAPANLN